MARFFFQRGWKDVILGSPKRDRFIAKRLSTIREFDVILNYQRKDLVDLPGDWRNRRGKPLRLKRPVFTHDFDTQGDMDGLLNRLASMPRKSIGVVRVTSSLEDPGGFSSILLMNNKKRGWVPWVDGSVLLNDYNISKLNPVSIV